MIAPRSNFWGWHMGPITGVSLLGCKGPAPLWNLATTWRAVVRIWFVTVWKGKKLTLPAWFGGHLWSTTRPAFSALWLDAIRRRARDWTGLVGHGTVFRQSVVLFDSVFDDLWNSVHFTEFIELQAWALSQNSRNFKSCSEMSWNLPHVLNVLQMSWNFWAHL